MPRVPWAIRDFLLLVVADPYPSAGHHVVLHAHQKQQAPLSKLRQSLYLYFQPNQLCKCMNPKFVHDV